MDSRLRGNDDGWAAPPSVIPAKAGIHVDFRSSRDLVRQWIPACAGMTMVGLPLLPSFPRRRESMLIFALHAALHGNGFPPARERRLQLFAGFASLPRHSSTAAARVGDGSAAFQAE